MSEKSPQVFCSGCGEVFAEFLQDMADRNESVVCPKCGHVHEQRLGKSKDHQKKPQ